MSWIRGYFARNSHPVYVSLKVETSRDDIDVILLCPLFLLCLFVQLLIVMNFEVWISTMMTSS